MFEGLTMKQCKQSSAYDERLVGDPVDVVTGANYDVNFEFQLPGPLPFIWQRHYDSSKCDQMFALGWGHTHSYDHQLRFNIDGIRYTGPLEKGYQFPPLLRDGERHAIAGYKLIRIGLMRYDIVDPSGKVLEFEFRDFHTPARLRALCQVDISIGFGYGEGGRLESIRDSQGRSIRVETDPKGRILSLTLFDAARPAGRILMSFRYDEMGNLVQGADSYRNTF